MSHTPKPFQLEFKTDRDNLNRWWSILTNFCRQKPENLPFFKGGSNETWTPEYKNPTRGLEDTKQQVALHNVITTIASFCPNGTFQTITAEADSLSWIYTRVAKMCHIQIGGRHLVNAWDLKYDKEIESPDIFYLRMKAAFSENLLLQNGIYNGVKQKSAEIFSPLAESMIVLKWLEAIHPSLPKHIQETKANLFTTQKPNFADIQQDLCEMMETLLQEIDQLESMSSLSIYDDRVVHSNRISYARGKGRNIRGRSKFAVKPWSVQHQYSPRGPPSDKSCKHCKAVGKDISVYSSHNVDMCFELYPEKRKTGVRLLSIPVHVDENDQFDPEEAEAFFQAYKMNQGISCFSDDNGNESQ